MVIPGKGSILGYHLTDKEYTAVMDRERCRDFPKKPVPLKMRYRFW
jgi:hypothetical protein